MGYTHYWTFHRNKTKDNTNFAKAVEEIKKIYANLPKRTKSAGGYYANHHVKIMDGVGKGVPEFTATSVCFNGNAKNGTDHETFSIDFNIDTGWNFCKTARKPYDLLVCCSLIAFAMNLGKTIFTFSSDGNVDDWQPAIHLYEEITGKTVPKEIISMI